jgi:electron transport complex protein RnfA
MIEFQTFFELILVTVILNNVVLTYFLGIESVGQLNKKPSEVLKLSVALLIVLPIVSVLSYLLYSNVLFTVDELGVVITDLTYLRTIVFVFIIIVVTYIMYGLTKTLLPKVFAYAGQQMKSLTINTVVLGSLLLNVTSVSSVLDSALFAVFVAFGYGLVLMLLTFVEKQLEDAPIPESFKGLPMQFIILAVIALIFSGFVA